MALPRPTGGPSNLCHHGLLCSLQLLKFWAHPPSPTHPHPPSPTLTHLHPPSPSKTRRLRSHQALGAAWPTPHGSGGPAINGSTTETETGLSPEAGGRVTLQEKLKCAPPPVPGDWGHGWGPFHVCRCLPAGERALCSLGPAKAAVPWHQDFPAQVPSGCRESQVPSQSLPPSQGQHKLGLCAAGASPQGSGLQWARSQTSSVVCLGGPGGLPANLTENRAAQIFSSRLACVHEWSPLELDFIQHTCASNSTAPHPLMLPLWASQGIPRAHHRPEGRRAPVPAAAVRADGADPARQGGPEVIRK